MKEDLVHHLKRKFEEAGQGHVFKGFKEKSKERQREFLQRASSIDLGSIGKMMDEAKFREVEKGTFSNLMPVDGLVEVFTQESRRDDKDVIEKGEEAIRRGRVCALLVAGGDGTRLGFFGPKGIISVTPVKNKSLFQVFAEQIQVAQQRYDCIIPWFIMTSEGNYDDTVSFFLENNQFGLTEVHFFKQGVCPVLDFKGKLLLDENGLIAMSPDGHGGCFEALNKSGCLEKMELLGVDIISYFQVDNPLVRCIDPAFIGLHILSDAEMSCKVVKKRDPSEHVGVFCQEDGKVKVVEYTYVSEEIREKCDENGELVFNLGNIGVHLIALGFAKKMGGSYGLPFHQIKKKVTFLDEDGHEIVPNEPNALKFEKLIFDALSDARKVILMEVLREEEFSPIKNAEGRDSLDTSKRDQILRSLRWLKKVGVDMDYHSEGLPVFAIEISPFFADSQSVFIQKWNSLLQKPIISEGTYLE